MDHPLFTTEKVDDVTTIRCKFCRSIRWAGIMAEGEKHVAKVCMCEGALPAIEEMLRERPATVDLNPDSTPKD